MLALKDRIYSLDRGARHGSLKRKVTLGANTFYHVFIAQDSRERRDGVGDGNGADWTRPDFLSPHKAALVQSPLKLTVQGQKVRDPTLLHT